MLYYYYTYILPRYNNFKLVIGFLGYYSNFTLGNIIIK